MEVLTFRCPWPECAHLESDTSAEAAKRRVRLHLTEVHGGGRLVVLSADLCGTTTQVMVDHAAEPEA